VQQALSESPLVPEDLADGAVAHHLEFLQRRRLCLLYPIESRGSTVQLYPREDLALPPETLSLKNDELLIFRHDLISYTYSPKIPGDLLIQTWILDQPQQLRLENLEGDPRGLQAIIGGPPIPYHKEVHVMGGHCRFPGAGYHLDRAWLMWASQTDAFIEMPTSRWDMTPYYTEETGVPGKCSTKHCAMLDFNELTAFDNRFFNLTENEARCIVPGQRVLLEITLEAFELGLGLSMPELKGRPVACVIADIGTDWDHFACKDTCPKEWLKVGGLGYSYGSAARVGYTFGITGPMHQVDTACSSSLVGANMIHGLVRKPEKGVTEGIVMAYINFLNPFPFIGLSAAGMLGRSGRSLTFDQAANGYNRGEGVGGLILKGSDDVKDFDSRVAAYVSSFVNQDGRSASLTAPNGPSQQACIRSSMRECNLQPDDIGFVENHGTGTALGDPIEVGSIRAVFGRRKGPPLPVTSGKTHVGHLESGAGSVGLLKMIASLTHMADAPNCHLRNLNAHMETEGFPVHFPIELLDVGVKEAVCGLNSFGFGGTNSRAELWGRCLAGPRRQSHWSRHVDKLDFVTVPCARCLGAMCWLCGVSIPSRPGRGKHYCSAVREELASYDYCSNCFGGSYTCGQASVEDAPDPGGRLFLTGTWSAWSTFEELEIGDGSAYVGRVVLGETLRERFRIVVEKDRRRAIYPVTARASQELRIIGPDSQNQGEDWIIDGRRDGVPAGTVYRVTFDWGSTSRSISWEPMQKEAPPTGPCYEHSYWICGSLTSWRPREMKRHPAEPGTWDFTGPIPDKTGGASFAFLRDNDHTQTIYPVVSTSQDTSVPVMGPGDGAPLAQSFQHWSVEGGLGVFASVQLRMAEGACRVTASAGDRTEVVWNSPIDKQDRYYVVGSFNGWSFTEMEQVDATPVYRLHFTIGYKHSDQFQIVLNRNWETRLHPPHANATPGLGIVFGPGPQGNGLNWMVAGPSGQVMEIMLDLTSEDRSGMVSCQPSMSLLEYS